MQVEGMLNESQFLEKPLTGKRLIILGQTEEEEYDYRGKIESIKRDNDFLVVEISEFCHRHGRNGNWHQQKDKHTIRIRIEKNGKFFEVNKDNYYLFYSKESTRADDVRIFVVQ